MKNFTTLSKHAKDRLIERTSLLETELINLLDRNSYINLGVEIGFYRKHCLFYSAKDEQYYVAVQDEKIGTVITILKLEYHLTLSWKLDKHGIEINDEILSLTKLYAEKSMKKSYMPSKIRLKVRYLDNNDNLKIEIIKKFNAACFAYNPVELIKHKQKIINVTQQWKKKKKVNKIIDIYSNMGKELTPYFAENSIIDNLNNI